MGVLVFDGHRGVRPARTGPHRPARRATAAETPANKLGAVALRLITAGESHGPGLTCIVEGLPAGLQLTPRTSTATWHGVSSATAAAGA